jgi:hypothetical protein
VPVAPISSKHIWVCNMCRLEVRQQAGLVLVVANIPRLRYYHRITDGSPPSLVRPSDQAVVLYSSRHRLRASGLDQDQSQGQVGNLSRNQVIQATAPPIAKRDDHM